MSAPAKAQAAGILSQGQQSLTLSQRAVYQRLKNQGMSDEVAKQLARALSKSAKPLGAAFSHARATGKDQSKEARKRRAAKWLSDEGHEPMGKSLALAKAAWSEADHPRDDKGEFGEAGGDNKRESTRHFEEGQAHLKAAGEALKRGDRNEAKAHMVAAKQSHSDAAKAGNAEIKEARAKVETAQRAKEKAESAVKAATAAKFVPNKKSEQANRDEARQHAEDAERHIASAKDAISRGDVSSANEHMANVNASLAQHGFSMKNADRAIGRQERAEGRASSPSPKAPKLRLVKSVALAKSAYHRNFVAGAKQVLDGPVFDALHLAARAKAGGKSSGEKRRASKDETKQALMAQRDSLRGSIKDLDAQLAKTAPLPNEVQVDALIGDQPKPKRKKKSLAERAMSVMGGPSSTPIAKCHQVTIVKAEESSWQKIVHSVVYEPNVPDTDDDYMTAEDIERMAHAAMKGGVLINHEHTEADVGAHVVESYIAPGDFSVMGPDGTAHSIRKGSWVMGLQVTDDDTWQRILTGEYGGFSMEGTALRQMAALP